MGYLWAVRTRRSRFRWRFEEGPDHPQGITDSEADPTDQHQSRDGIGQRKGADPGLLHQNGQSQSGDGAHQGAEDRAFPGWDREPAAQPPRPAPREFYLGVQLGGESVRHHGSSGQSPGAGNLRDAHGGEGGRTAESRDVHLEGYGAEFDGPAEQSALEFVDTPGVGLDFIH